MSFAKRVNELGYGLRDRDDLNLADRLEVAGSDRSDLEKMEYFGQDRLDEVLGAFDTIFSDHTIDIQTGELLGRYVAEEFDTARLLRCCYEQLKARQGETRCRGDVILVGAEPRARWPRSTTRWTRCAAPSKSCARSCARRACRPRRPERTLRHVPRRHGVPVGVTGVVVPVREGLFTDADPPQLLGSRCGRADATTSHATTPAPTAPPTRLVPVELSGTGSTVELDGGHHSAARVRRRRPLRIRRGRAARGTARGDHG